MTILFLPLLCPLAIQNVHQHPNRSSADLWDLEEAFPVEDKFIYPATSSRSLVILNREFYYFREAVNGHLLSPFA